jgi:hypothetical protein
MNQDPNGRPKINRLIPYVFGIIVVLILIWWIIIPRLRATQFCTQNDEVYQAIEENVQNWLTYFRTLPKNQYPALTFSVSSGKTYIVNASTWEIDVEPPELLIQTENLRQEPYGLTGYVYTPIGNITLDKRYQIQHLAADIYCYRLH